MTRIGFGGGCHWCTEAVFQYLRGVTDVKQGFIRSEPPYEDFSEAVIVTFEADEIPLEVLIEIHLHTHSSQSQHKMRGKYRSAIYIFNKEQQSLVSRHLAQLQLNFDKKLVTQVLNYVDFKPSDERFHNYYKTAPERPFCKNYINPKLALLRSKYTDYTRIKS